MDIMELAALLGKTLKEDERLVKLAEAKKEYTSDAELQKKLVSIFRSLCVYVCYIFLCMLRSACGDFRW